MPRDTSKGMRNPQPLERLPAFIQSRLSTSPRVMDQSAVLRDSQCCEEFGRTQLIVRQHQWLNAMFGLLFSPVCANLGRRFGCLLRGNLETELFQWRRRCDRLTHLQRRIRFPPLDTITVDGQDVKLPLPAVEAVRSPSQEELEYLVGFFDGDGCVDNAHGPERHQTHDGPDS